MISPFEGRVTGPHGDAGGYRGHKGLDIAPPKPGQVNLPVYSAFDMTIQKLYRNAPAGNKLSTWAKGRTANGILGSNPDGEGNGYNHVSPLPELRIGQKIKAGQLIGHIDRSGTQTNTHLHFELWADWRDDDSDYDPMLAFDKFGVKAGSKPLIPETPVIVPVAVVKPVATPVKPVQRPSEANKRVQRILRGMDLYFGAEDGVDGSRQQAAVKGFQRAHSLHPDGKWGSVTEARYQWNVDLQNALKAMAGVPDAWKSDGYLGATTSKWRRYTEDRQGWGRTSNAQIEQKLRAVKAWK